MADADDKYAGYNKSIALDDEEDDEPTMAPRRVLSVERRASARRRSCEWCACARRSHKRAAHHIMRTAAARTGAVMCCVRNARSLTMHTQCVCVASCGVCPAVPLSCSSSSMAHQTRTATMKTR
jgi:hypothetical protein